MLDRTQLEQARDTVMTRLELFRRILYDTIGRDSDAGLIPADAELIGSIVGDICLDNATRCGL